MTAATAPHRCGLRLFQPAYGQVMTPSTVEAEPAPTTTLHEAGVPVLLYESDAGGPRNLRFAAGMAVRNDFTRSEAIRAIMCSDPASIFL